MISAKLIILPILAGLLTFALTPTIRRISARVGAVDLPNHRKKHDVAVPSSGGVAIFFGFLIAILFFNRTNPEIIGFLLGATIVTGMGLLDDIFDLPPVSKLFGQIVATLLVIYSGVNIEAVGNLFAGNEALLDLGFLALPLTFLWIVGITNAINFLDGLDGLAAGVVGISATSLGFVALMTGRVDAAVLAFTLAAAAIAFLPHNFSFKSKVFMGDSGSNFLGFSLAVISILGAVKVAAAFSMIVPLLILAVPILDIFLVVLRRIKSRRPITESDREHFHHKLVDIMGLTQREAVFFIYVLTLVFSGLALVTLGFPLITAAMIFALSILLLSIITLIFVTWHHRKRLA